MFIPYNVEVPMARLPLANWVLIGITTIISFSIMMRPESGAQAREHEMEQVWRRVNAKDISPEELDQLVQNSFRRNLDELLPALALKRQSFSLVQLFSYL